METLEKTDNAIEEIEFMDRVQFMQIEEENFAINLKQIEKEFLQSIINKK